MLIKNALDYMLKLTEVEIDRIKGNPEVTVIEIQRVENYYHAVQKLVMDEIMLNCIRSRLEVKV